MAGKLTKTQRDLCPMPSTCGAVGGCLYPASACLTSPRSVNDLTAVRFAADKANTAGWVSWFDWPQQLAAARDVAVERGLILARKPKERVQGVMREMSPVYAASPAGRAALEAGKE